MRICPLQLATLFLAILPLALFAQEDNRFTDHGVAVDVSRHHGAGAVVGGTGERLLLAWLHSFNHVAMIAVNLDAGTTTQFAPAGPPAGCGGPFRSLRSRRNLWYTHSAGYFYEFDPSVQEFTFVQEMQRGRCAMSATEDADGVIWMALYPTAELFSFNPDTRELVNHGPLNRESWPQYPQRGLAMDDDGWIYTGIGNVQGQVVGFNPADGEIRRYVEAERRALGTGRVIRAEDGQVYANAPNWGWHRMSAGTATPVEEPPARDAMHHTARASSSDGRPLLAFPDGSRVENLDIEGRRLVVAEADGGERSVAFDYESGGSLIVGMVPAPDGGVYGVTGRPNYIFHFDPREGTMTSHQLWGGRWNAMTMRGETPFGAIYTRGWLASFDFGKPLDPGDSQDSNPRRHANAEPHINRPAALLAHPDGRHMVMGGTPGYGRTGGGLFIYDLEAETSTVLTHEQLLENLSTCALAALPNGNLVGGTTTAPGTGGVRVAEEAELYLFDWARREVVWRQAILPGRQALRDLVLGPDGLLYGIADDATLFVFDPVRRSLVHEERLTGYGPPAGSQSPRSMIQGPDGMVYALFRNAVARIQPGTFEHVKLADSPVAISAGIVLVDGHLYFGSGSRLWSFRLAEGEEGEDAPAPP